MSVGTAITNEARDPSDVIAPDEFGLSHQRHIMNAKDLTSFIAAIITDEFGYDRLRKHLIQKQFTEFLPRLGADNESTFALLAEDKLWFHGSLHVAYSQETVPIVRLLTQLAEYTGMVLRRLKYLTPSARYKSLPT
eukprot:UN11048